MVSTTRPAPRALLSNPAEAATRRTATPAAVQKPAARASTSSATPGYPAGTVSSHADSRAKGAYFYKMEAAPSIGSSGIRAVGTLPELRFDPNRNHVEGLPAAVRKQLPKSADSHVGYYSQVYKAGASDPSATLSALNSHRTGPLDRPSVYLGGHSKPANVEVDTGLSTDRVYDARGNATFTTAADMTGGRGEKVFAVGGTAPNRFVYDTHAAGAATKPTAAMGADGKPVQGDAAVLAYLDSNKMVPNFGFRPFWRVADQSKPEGQRNTWTNPPKTDSNQYLYPGQRVSMSVTAAGQPTTMTTTIAALDASGKPTVPAQGGAHSFAARGFDNNATSAFKRINSIDLFHVVNGERLGTEAKAAVKAVPAKDGQPAVAAAAGRSAVRADAIRTNTVASDAVWTGTEVRGRDGKWSPLLGGQQRPTLVRGSEWPEQKIDAFLRIFHARLDQGSERITITPGRR
jgi:hypothetical protein